MLGHDDITSDRVVRKDNFLCVVHHNPICINGAEICL